MAFLSQQSHYNKKTSCFWWCCCVGVVVPADTGVDNVADNKHY